MATIDTYLSIVATRLTAALGGRFEHPTPRREEGAASSHRESAEPLIVFFHGHGFNAAMWGRFVLSLSLAGYATLCVNYELHSPLMNSPGRHESIADLGAVVAEQLAARHARESRSGRVRPRRHSSGAQPLRPAVFCAHSLGGLVATHVATQAHSRDLGLDVKGVIAIATPFGGVPLLSWLVPMIAWLPSFFKPSKCVMEMHAHSQVCAVLRTAAVRHAQQGCSYHCIAGWCDPVVPLSSASVIPEPQKQASARLASKVQTVLVSNEGHFTITMSDRLIALVVQWVAEILARATDKTDPSRRKCVT